ncbi:MAG: type III pantothenate kinase [Calditrichia bacterium]
MIILGIDVGNTHAQVGIIRDGNVHDSVRLSTVHYKTEDEIWLIIDQFLGRNSLSPLNIDHVCISSVVPGMNFILQKLVEKYFHREAIFISHEMDLGIQINYSNPSQVGPDRLCNAVAAWNIFHDNCIILDFGTATTFDIVYKEGSYEGGIIAAGLETTNWGLHEKAAMLPRVKFEYPETVIGKETQIAIQIGLIRGTINLINGLIREITEETGRSYKLITTGGLSKLINPHLIQPVHYEPYLVLNGIHDIVKRVLTKNV